MFNIFQGNELIKNTIAEILGYNSPERGWFTRDMYFEAFFYLSKRFGEPKLFDKYKEAGCWSFDVKDYVIQIRMNSSWVEFMIYGRYSNMSTHSPYVVKLQRERNKKQDQIIPEHGQWNDRQKELADNLFSVFCEEYNIDETITQEQFDHDFRDKWFEYVCTHNEKIVNVNYREIEEKYGVAYQNSYTKHAIRTLRQFLKNMLTPIWVRDCPFNIKGRISDEQASFYSRYSSNIKIKIKSYETVH